MATRIDHAKLERLLDEVRASLKAGDYQQLAALATEQERMISQLRDSPAASDAGDGILERIVQAARRNQRLIEAALSGFKSGARRREDQRAATRPIRTYDRSGQKTPLDPVVSTLEKRS